MKTALGWNALPSMRWHFGDAPPPLRSAFQPRQGRRGSASQGKRVGDNSLHP